MSFKCPFKDIPYICCDFMGVKHADEEELIRV